MKAIANHTTGTSEDCEAMLAILKDKQHKDVIPKYLPKAVEVAHKTGSESITMLELSIYQTGALMS